MFLFLTSSNFDDVFSDRAYVFILFLGGEGGEIVKSQRRHDSQSVQNQFTISSPWNFRVKSIEIVGVMVNEPGVIQFLKIISRLRKKE